MANRLKIYACSGVGDTSVANQSGYNYWADNIDSVNSTQAVNLIYTRIQLLYSQLIGLPLTNSEIIEHLDAIDFYSIAIYYADKYAGNTAKLEIIGNVISETYAAGMIHNESLDNNERDKYLDELFAYIDKNENKTDIKQTSAGFNSFWKEYVLDLNQIGLTEEQRAIPLPKIEAIAGANDDIVLSDKNIGDFFRQAGKYFLYTYFTDDQLERLPRLFTLKKRNQMFVYENCLATFRRIFGKKEAMDNLIRSRINEEFHSQPEEICKDIAEKGGSSQYYSQAVGVVPVVMIGKVTLEAFLIILSLAITFIIGIVKAILVYCAEVEAARQHAIEEKAIDQSGPEPEDYTGLAWKYAKEKALKSPITYVALAVIAWLFLENK